MTLDGFLTFIGLMIATYAILAPLSRLRLTLNLYRQIAVLSISLLLVLFFEFFFEIREILGSKLPFIFQFFDFKTDGLGFTNHEAAFLTVLSWMVFAIFLHLTAKPNAIGLKSLGKLVERLHDEDRILEIIELTTPYFPIIHKAKKKELWGQRTYYKILDLSRDTSGSAFEFLDSGGAVVWPWLRPIMRPFAIFFPKRPVPVEASERLVELLLNSDKIRSFIATKRPQFALELIDLNPWNYEGFTIKYFKELVSQEGSHLFKEMPANQNMVGAMGYYLNPNNKLTFGLLDDPKFALDNAIYKTLADAIIQLVTENTTYKEKLNMPPPREEDLWRDPVYCALHFFSIMITRSVAQGIKDHMWLMYLSVFVEKIVDNHTSTNPNVDFGAEFPTLGCRLIYEAISSQGSWAELATNLPENNPHVFPDQLQGHSFFSIPRWGAVDLAKSIKSIIRSDKLPEQFIAYMFECYIRDIRDMNDEGPLAPLRATMISELMECAHGFDVSDWRGLLQSRFNSVDHVLRYDVPDFQAALDN